MLSDQHALVAQNNAEGLCHLEWIADSGAGRDLASVNAFEAQGVPPNVLYKATSSKGSVRFETGNGQVTSDSIVLANGDQFGSASFCMLEACPLVRSLGQLVEAGRPFVWIPGELPFLGADMHSVQVTADKTKIVHANRVDDYVPIFSETIQFDDTSFGLAASSSAAPPAAPEPVADAAEVPVADGDGDSENDDEEPLNRHARLYRESRSIEHQRLHIPKNPYCEVCQRSRVYKKRTQARRYDRLGSRGDLPEVTSFGERLACDFIIVSKARTEGRNNNVLVVRDEFSGLVRAFPRGSKSSETINKHLLSFLGPSYNHVPSFMMKSDQASEFSASCAQLGFQQESTLERTAGHTTPSSKGKFGP